jgi:hypothetical protein
MYAEYPSLRDADLTQAQEGMFGNLCYNYEFRGPYATLLARWLGLDAKSIVSGSFEQLPLL